jgi:hypothetical protein
MEIIKQLFVVNGTVAISVKGSSEATDLLRCEAEPKSAHGICELARVQSTRVVTIHSQEDCPGV